MNNKKGKMIIFAFVALGIALIYWAIVTQPAPQRGGEQGKREKKKRGY